jgi:hypothetical protein
LSVTVTYNKQNEEERRGGGVYRWRRKFFSTVLLIIQGNRMNLYRTNKEATLFATS